MHLHNVGKQGLRTTSLACQHYASAVIAIQKCDECAWSQALKGPHRIAQGAALGKPA